MDGWRQHVSFFSILMAAVGQCGPLYNIVSLHAPWQALKHGGQWRGSLEQKMGWKRWKTQERLLRFYFLIHYMFIRHRTAWYTWDQYRKSINSVIFTAANDDYFPCQFKIIFWSVDDISENSDKCPRWRHQKSCLSDQKSITYRYSSFHWSPTPFHWRSWEQWHYLLD